MALTTVIDRREEILAKAKLHFDWIERLIAGENIPFAVGRPPLAW